MSYIKENKRCRKHQFRPHQTPIQTGDRRYSLYQSLYMRNADLTDEYQYGVGKHNRHLSEGTVLEWDQVWGRLS